MQEELVVQPKGSTDIFFRDGRPWAGKYSRFMLEHAGSRNKISAGQMWEFVTSLTSNDMGIIHNHILAREKKKGNAMSRRFVALTRTIFQKWPHMLIDIDGSRT